MQEDTNDLNKLFLRIHTRILVEDDGRRLHMQLSAFLWFQSLKGNSGCSQLHEPWGASLWNIHLRSNL